MRLRQVLAIGSLPFIKIGNRRPAGSHPRPSRPEIEGPKHGTLYQGIVKIQIGLMGIEAMPEIRFRNGIPSPVGRLEIFEDDPCFFVFFGRVTPDVEVAPA